MTEALANLDGEFSGKYYPLSKMTDAEQEQLIEVRNSSAHLQRTCGQFSSCIHFDMPLRIYGRPHALI